MTRITLLHAQQARAILRAFADHDAVSETDAADLIASLRHLAQVDGWDWSAVEEIALRVWECEHANKEKTT